jgi:hypothetical protein
VRDVACAVRRHTKPLEDQIVFAQRVILRVDAEQSSSSFRALSFRGFRGIVEILVVFVVLRPSTQREVRRAFVRVQRRRRI